MKVENIISNSHYNSYLFQMEKTDKHEILREIDIDSKIDLELKVVNQRIIPMETLKTPIVVCECEITKGLHKGSKIDLSLHKYPKLRVGITYTIYSNEEHTYIRDIDGHKREIKTNTLFFIKKK